MRKIDIEDLSEKELEDLIEEVGSKLFSKRLENKVPDKGLEELKREDFQDLSFHDVEGAICSIPEATGRNFLVALNKINEIVRHLKKKDNKEGGKVKNK